MSTYKASSISALILNESNSKSSLTPQGSVSDSYRSMCIAIGEAIAETHNTWQQSAIINGIMVSGGSCSPQGPLSGGIGIGSPGSILGTVSGTTSALLSRFPTNAMTSRTPALLSHITAIAQAFEETFNNFLSSANILNIQVSGGTCTCMIVPPGVPVPGTYIGGSGELSSLSGNVVGSPVTKGIIRSAILSKLDSNILAKGSPTLSLSEGIDAIAQAIEDTHNSWMNTTKIQSLQVVGGVTFPGSPIIGALGSSGIFV